MLDYQQAAMRRGRSSSRAKAAVRAAEDFRLLWTGLVLAGVLGFAGAAFGQASVPAPATGGAAGGGATGAVPEVVRPRTDSPSLPGGPSDGAGVRPRSENPLADGQGVRPIPDSGVVTPPPAALGSTPVIRPPAVGTMPVIPPPGSPGGERGVVPK